jgi:hypothetical protein
MDNYNSLYCLILVVIFVLCITAIGITKIIVDYKKEKHELDILYRGEK